MWRSFKSVVAAWLLVATCVCHAAPSNASGDLLRSYDDAMSLYKKGDVFAAYSRLSSFFEVNNYADFSYTFSPEKYAEILNDYAFFMEKYYEKQAGMFCRGEGGTSRDFLTFQASILDEAKEILEFVLQLTPDRASAYLNLADVLYELDWDKEAAGYYAKYAELQRIAGRSMAKRATNASLRKKYYRCK